LAMLLPRAPANQTTAPGRQGKAMGNEATVGGLPRRLLKFSGGSVDILRDVFS
jgi:hypothetical protein